MRGLGSLMLCLISVVMGTFSSILHAAETATTAPHSDTLANVPDAPKLVVSPKQTTENTTEKPKESKTKAEIAKEEHAALLDTVLGSLTPTADDQFTLIDEAGIQGDLAESAQKKALGTNNNTAYIIQISDKKVVWSIDDKAEMVFDTSSANPFYALQWLTLPPLKAEEKTKLYQIAVQNFWLYNATGTRIEYQLIVSQPTIKE